MPIISPAAGRFKTRRDGHPFLGEVRRLAIPKLGRYSEAVTGSKLMPRVIASIQTFGARINSIPR